MVGARVYYYDSDGEPIYSLAHAGDLTSRGAPPAYKTPRRTRGENVWVKDMGISSTKDTRLYPREEPLPREVTRPA